MTDALNFPISPGALSAAEIRQLVGKDDPVIIEVGACAIGAVHGTISFHQSSGAEHLPQYSEGWDQSGSIRRPNSHLKVWPWVKFEKQITVPITTLDAWSEQHKIGKADFIWADVQGAESDLVEGAAQFLRSTRYFYTEYSNDEWYEGQITLAELLKKLPNFDLVRRYATDALFRNKAIAPKTTRSTYPTIRL